MKEFMFYIRNEQDAKKSLTEDQHLAFIKKCEVYIGKLKSENKLTYDPGPKGRDFFYTKHYPLTP